MSRKKLVVPNARKAFEEFKMEIAREYGVDDPRSLASTHTGQIVRRLVEMGEKQILNNKDE